jgi:uncharacterized membrane protein
MSPDVQAARPASADGGAQDSMVALKLVVAWAIVGVPLAWGVWKVVLNALKLFK